MHEEEKWEGELSLGGGSATPPLVAEGGEESSGRREESGNPKILWEEGELRVCVHDGG